MLGLQGWSKEVIRHPKGSWKVVGWVGRKLDKALDASIGWAVVVGLTALGIFTAVATPAGQNLTKVVLEQTLTVVNESIQTVEVKVGLEFPDELMEILDSLDRKLQ